eukprot:g28150.t1
MLPHETPPCDVRSDPNSRRIGFSTQMADGARKRRHQTLKAAVESCEIESMIQMICSGTLIRFAGKLRRGFARRSVPLKIRSLALDKEFPADK